jgi:cell division protein FtsB
MSVLKCLIAAWIAAAVYAFTSIYIGTMGISAYNQLRAERDKQQANLENLQRINRGLEGTMEALRYDSDTLEVYARELGYGSKDERFVRIVGLRGTAAPQIPAGHVVSPAGPPRAVPDKTLRIVSACAGLGMFLCLALSGILFQKQRRP